MTKPENQNQPCIICGHMKTKEPKEFFSELFDLYSGQEAALEIFDMYEAYLASDVYDLRSREDRWRLHKLTIYLCHLLQLVEDNQEKVVKAVS